MPIIYGIWADDARLPYYGSTTQTLAKRKKTHKGLYKLWKEKGDGSKCSSFDLFDAVGFDACQFEIVESLPDDISKDNLLLRERWNIENRPCINKHIPIRTDEEYVEYHRKYREERREEKQEYARQYHDTHKEEHKEYMREYHEEHKEEKKEYNQQYREAHKEELDEYQRQYYEAHKEEKKERARQRYARKRAERVEAFKALLKTDA
jgi:hypothetical protein